MGQVALDRSVTGPQGTFMVSTIQTFAGGAAEEKELGSPFSTKDYVGSTPWFYETVVFQDGSKGCYHEPYATKEEAITRHRAIVSAIRDGKLELGKGVNQYGNPSTTLGEWKQILAEKERA